LKAVPESKRVANFLKGITDSKLELAVSVVPGDPTLLNDFQSMPTTILVDNN
jgi:hypothetical protein